LPVNVRVFVLPAHIAPAPVTVPAVDLSTVNTAAAEDFVPQVGVEPAVETTAEQQTIVETNESTNEPQEETPWWEKKEVQDLDQQKTEDKVEPAVELDDDLKLILEYKKSGKTLADFVKEYQVSDFAEWTDEKFVKEGLKEFMNLTPEEIEQASYEFDNASVFQKKQWA
jgi:hypothetical protein